MTGAAFEAFLAKLYTDEEFLKCFLADPLAVARQAGLSGAECDALAAVDTAGLRLAADGFRKKKALTKAQG